MDNNNQCKCPICKQRFTPAEGMTGNEHIARGMLKTYAEIQHKLNGKNIQLCPRCGKKHMALDILQNPKSQYFDIHICETCGEKEIVEAVEENPIPLESWWIVKELKLDDGI